MTHSYDTDWLVTHRPQPDAPSSRTTADAREALIAHGLRRQRGRRRTFALTAAGVLAVGVAGIATIGATPPPAAVGRSPVTLGRAPRGPARGGPTTPLVRLAADVHRLRSPVQPGNATLVVRYTLLKGVHEIDGAVYGGYDLYTDSGRYYYAPFSLAQLQQLYDTHQVSIGGGDEARALDMIAAAAGGTPAEARGAVLSTEPRDGRPPTPAEARAFLRQLPAPDRRRFEAAASHPDLRLYEDSNIWGDATEALAVGAGRPDVRAAAIKALSTLAGVIQKPTRVDGQRALEVIFPDDNYPERIWLDARTGVPIQEKDGANSATAFAVERVIAAHLPARLSPTSRLR
jgi:hypothetical protein